MTEEQTPPPVVAMMQMIGGFWVSRAIFAAASLGLADLISLPKSADEVAAATGTNGRSMYRLLRALSSVGIFRERDDGKFESTPLSDTLRSDAPQSVRYTAMSELGVSHYGPWGEVIHSIKTGLPAFDQVFGMPVFEWFARNPERSKVFNRSMSELTAMVEPAVLEAYDFADCGTIVDVGGGHGSLLAAILGKHTNLRGVVYDSQNVVDGAPARLQAVGLADRTSVVGGDFFASVPSGGDTYIMKHIIHDWDDERCKTILRHCHKVMKTGSRVLIIDQVLPGKNEPSIGKFTDLLMLVMPGGVERTAEEFKALLEQSGFEFGRIVPTNSLVGIVEGVKRS